LIVKQGRQGPAAGKKVAGLLKLLGGATCAGRGTHCRCGCGRRRRVTADTAMMRAQRLRETGRDIGGDVDRAALCAQFVRRLAQESEAVGGIRQKVLEVSEG
jgi:hypothetical protein